MTWTPDIPQGNESAKVKYEIVPYTRGKVLEVGSGPWRTFPHFITVDNMSEWTGQWRPDIICDAAKLSIFSTGYFDAVFSSHVLEHFEDADAVLMEWWRLVKRGGYLVIYLPHADYYPKIGEPGANEDHKHDFLPKDIIAMMKDTCGWDLVVSDNRNEGNEYSFLQVYRKIGGKDRLFSYCDKKPDKTAAIVRYGGLGDMLQISPIIASLKDLGYHTTIYTTPSAYPVIENDPHLDNVILQDKDQVPNNELFEFWETISKKYDKFINLSESVEGSFLALQGRAPFMWPKDARDRYMNINYDEFAHLIAGVPKKHHAKFYPTDIEKRSMAKCREAIGGRLIMMSISGSSVHKIYPWMDQVIVHFMLNYSDVKFVLVGAQADQFLESPWTAEKRVILKSGKLTVRESMTLAAMCDCVVGPETGMLNSVSYEKVPKVILLSHSTVENLTRDWTNTQSLAADDCPCYPCHRMIYGFADCTRGNDTGVSLCMEMLTPDRVIAAIEKVI